MPLIILNVIFSGVSIWISQRAKPVGDMPYRWGVYLGMVAAWMALILIVSSVQALGGGQTPGGSVLCIVAVLAAVSSLGILRRRKFGVVTFALMYVLLILIFPFVEPMPGQTFLLAIRDEPAFLAELGGEVKSFPLLGSLLFAVVYFAITFIYFKDR
jgi:hypothetical protein